MFRLIVFLAAILLAATPAVAADPAPEDRDPGPAEAKIVVYRVVGYARLRAFTVEINDIDAIKLNEGQHSWLFLKPGPYRVEVDLPWDLELFGENQPAQPVLEAGQTYYFRLVIRMESLPDGWSLQTAEIVPVSERRARAEMQSPQGFGYPTGYRKPQAGYKKLGATDR